MKYTNCNLLEYVWIRKGIRTSEAQINEKNKDIEAQQNVTGSYKKWVYHEIFFTKKESSSGCSQCNTTKQEFSLKILWQNYNR